MVGDIKSRAHNKAFAKLTMLNFEINDLRADVIAKNTQGITLDELIMIFEGAKLEHEVWNYIMELIEKNNKYEK
tara:strand:+ start:365 stop:586 length:222 start_codon:yes stop_codon:yes gene_type:complete